MQISKIEQQKRRQDRYSVFLDGQYAFSLSDENLVKLRLKEGMEVDPDALKGILAEEEKRQAMDYAWQLIGIRNRSTKELEERLLKKEYTPQTATGVIARLTELGYLNDAKFATDWASYLSQKGKGPELVRLELRKKGIRSEIVNEVLGTLKASPEDEEERVKALAEQKMKHMKDLPADVVARRLTGFLARRGYSLDTVKKVIRELRKDLSQEGE
jgi:regulatory protein